MLEIIKETLKTLNTKEKNKIYFLIFLSTISVVLETFGVSLIIPFVALILEDNVYEINPYLSDLLVKIGSPEKFELLVIGFIILVVFFLIKSSFSSFLIFKQTNFVYFLRATISKKLFSTYLFQNLKFYMNENSSKLIRNIRAETDLFIEIVITSSLILISEFMIILGIVFLLIFVEPYGAILVLSLVGSIFGMHQLLTKKVTKKYAEIRQYYDGLCIKLIQQAFNSIINVKIQGNENSMLQKFSDYAHKSADAQRFQTAMQELPRLWLEFFALLGLTTLVLFLFNSGSSNTEIMTTVGLFGAAAFKILPSLNRIFVSAQKLRFGQPVVNIITEAKILEKKIVYKNLSKPIDFDQNEKKENFLEIKGLKFAYDKNKNHIFKDVDLTISKSEKIGIFGGSGTGKSTLVNLITGLIKPDEGTVSHYGLKIENILGYYHKKIGYVSQNIFLHDETIKNNITFFNEEKVDNERIEYLIEKLELTNLIKSLPDGINSVVGENAVKISGGQKQRIGIARALYPNPEFLIMDESTNALDQLTEESIIRTIFGMKDIKNIICISHKMSNLKFCDKVYEISNNKILLR